MAITVPTAGTEITASAFGKPVADQLNLIASVGSPSRILKTDFVNGANTNSGTALGNRDKCVVTPGTFTVPVTVIALSFLAGGGPGTLYDWVPEIYVNATGAVTRSYGIYTSRVTNVYTSAAMLDSWNVAANGNTGYTVRANLQTNTGAAAFWLMGGAVYLIVAQ